MCWNKKMEVTTISTQNKFSWFPVLANPKHKKKLRTKIYDTNEYVGEIRRRISEESRTNKQKTKQTTTMKNFSTLLIVITIILLSLLSRGSARIASFRSQLEELETPAKTTPVLTSVSLLPEAALGDDDNNPNWGGTCGPKDDATKCPTDCCYSENVNNQCTSNSDNNSCQETPDAATIDCGACCGYYACLGVSHDSRIGPSSCHDSYACSKLTSSHLIGPNTCIGYLACYELNSSTVSQSSCKGLSACRGTDTSTIEANSCTGGLGQGVCWYCDNSKVLANECNSLPPGWYEFSNSSDIKYYNHCRFCTNCKNQATKQSCYISNMSASISALSKGSYDPNTGDDIECTKLMTTITTLFQSLDNDVIKKLIGKYVTSKIKKTSDVCLSQLYFTFDHLNEDELVSTCHALEAVFSEHIEKWLNLHPLYTDMTLSCEPKDLNAGKVQEIQEWPKTLEENESSVVFML